MKVTDFGLSKAGFIGRRYNGTVESMSLTSIPSGSSVALSSSSSIQNNPNLNPSLFKSEFKHYRRGSAASNISVSSLDSSASKITPAVSPMKPNKFVGTPDYLSPESILGLSQDAGVDWVFTL